MVMWLICRIIVYFYLFFIFFFNYFVVLPVMVNKDLLYVCICIFDAVCQTSPARNRFDNSLERQDEYRCMSYRNCGQLPTSLTPSVCDCSHSQRTTNINMHRAVFRTPGNQDFTQRYLGRCWKKQQLSVEMKGWGDPGMTPQPAHTAFQRWSRDLARHMQVKRLNTVAAVASQQLHGDAAPLRITAAPVLLLVNPL